MFTVYARMIGTKVCMTKPNGQFVMCDRSEMTEEELKVIDAGGGNITLNPIMHSLSWN